MFGQSRRRIMNGCSRRRNYPAGTTTTPAEGSWRRASTAREFGSDQRDDMVKYVIAVEVPNMEAHSEHDGDPACQAFDQRADAFQPEQPLVHGGKVLHSIG
jgi:hypothetical protein